MERYCWKSQYEYCFLRKAILIVQHLLDTTEIMITIKPCRGPMLLVLSNKAKSKSSDILCFELEMYSLIE